VLLRTVIRVSPKGPPDLVNHDGHDEPSLTKTTALKPFHRSESGDFWTANLLHTNYTATFAYTYPIFTDLTPSDTLIRRVNQLYSPKQSPTHVNTRRDVNADAPHRQPGLTERASSAIAAAVAFGAGVQYTFSVEAQQSSLEGSPSVLVYLRSSSSNGSESEEENGPLFVGQTSFVQQVLAPADTATDADTAGDGYQPTVRSEVPLTAALEARFQSGELGGLDAETVKGYLNERLEWEIVKVRVLPPLPQSDRLVENRVSS
jgi:tyrosinase